MKVLSVFLAIVVLSSLVGCGDSFDAEAEKEAVAAFDTAWTEATAKGDREATRTLLGEDWTVFVSLPDWYHKWTPEDETPDWWTDPAFDRWIEWEDFVSTDLAVRRGVILLDPSGDAVRVFATSVLKKENGQWKLLHVHESYAGE